MTHIGNNIKKIRTTKGLSQQAFADIFELTRGNISSYEENRAEPRIAMAIRIANYFSIPFEAFVSQNLTVNQILNFKGDKLMEEEKSLNALQLKEVPFLNDNIFLQCSNGKLSFMEFEKFPKLVLPSSTSLAHIALTYNANIPHPSELPKYGENDILVFEALTKNNFHLSVNQLGLYIESNEIILGQFQPHNKSIRLVLNSFKYFDLDFSAANQFWRLHASYKHY